MKIEYLNWDSDFFGFNVGKAISHERIAVPQGDYDLIYNFVEVSHHSLDPTHEYENDLVDIKIIFTKEIDPAFRNTGINVEEISHRPIDNKIYTLAYEAGNYSRFKKDKKIAKEKFYNLYKLWVENANATLLVAYSEAKEIIGMMTLTMNDNIATIGLIAVDDQCRKKGVGAALIVKGEEIALASNCIYIDVATQYKNSNAMKFYHNFGFKIKSATKIYHLWK